MPDMLFLCVNPGDGRKSLICMDCSVCDAWGNLIVIVVSAVQSLFSASPRYCLVSAGKHDGFAAIHSWSPTMH